MDQFSKKDNLVGDQVVVTGMIQGWEAEDSASPELGSGSAPAPPARPTTPLGNIVPASVRYPFRKLLGKGGMGVVQLCKDLTIGREVALKRMLTGEEHDVKARARFIREAQVQGQLEHPAIVPVYDLSVDENGAVFFTMKRLSGRTLEEILEGLKQKLPEDCKAFPLHRLLQAFSAVCLAVEFAHSRGILHRDLKPANIMLGDFGEVYVLDWGVAKLLGRSAGRPLVTEAKERESLTSVTPPPTLASEHNIESVKTEHGQLAGTISYMSPEQTQLDGPALDGRSDIFTLGVILFEILTLERLRPKGTLEQIYLSIRQERCERPSHRAPQRDIPPELDEICLRAMQRDPAVRHPTARALHQCIEGFLSGERDLALRRELSVEHEKFAAVAVEQALGGGPEANEARRSALTEVGQALALDPANGSALRLLHRLLSEPPRRLPPEVEAMVASDLVVREQLRLRSLVLSGSGALMLTPFLLLMGVRNWPVMGLLVLFSILNIALRWWVSHPTTPTVWRYLSQVVSLAMMFCCGRILGPLLLMTMPLTVHALLHSISGQAALRRFVLLTSCSLLIGMVVLEYLGWLTPSYHFADGALVIVPNLANLPPNLTMALLLSISLLYIVLPAMSISRLPVHLAEAERRLALHSWQLRQLLPDANKPTSILRRPSNPTLQRPSL